MSLTLQCHADTPSSFVQSIAAEIQLSQNGQIILKFHVSGEIDAIKFLEKSEPKRTDYLWQQTCFEAFIGRENEDSYFEFNFSPCTEWAAYSFESHRKGMVDLDMVTDPVISVDLNQESYSLLVNLNLAETWVSNSPVQLILGLSAVVEDQNGHKSLWALQHPSGNPDFHHRDCFAHQLKAADSL